MTLATGRRSSAFFSKMTRPVEASQRIALGLVSVIGASASIGVSSAFASPGSKDKIISAAHLIFLFMALLPYCAIICAISSRLSRGCSA